MTDVETESEKLYTIHTFFYNLSIILEFTFSLINQKVYELLIDHTYLWLYFKSSVNSMPFEKQRNIQASSNFV